MVRAVNRQHVASKLIWDPLTQLPVQELAGYDFRSQDLFDQITEEITRRVPVNQLLDFKKRLILEQLKAEEIAPLRHDIDQLFERAIRVLIKHGLENCKQLLYKCAKRDKFPLGFHAISRTERRKFNRAYLLSFANTGNQILLNKSTSKKLFKALVRELPDEDLSIYKTKTIYINHANAHLLLRGINFTIDPTSRHLRSLHEQLNLIRYSLTEEDHISIFGFPHNDPRHTTYEIPQDRLAEFFQKATNPLTTEQLNDLPPEVLDEVFSTQRDEDNDLVMVEERLPTIKALNRITDRNITIPLTHSDRARMLGSLNEKQLKNYYLLSYNKVGAIENGLSYGSDYFFTANYSINTGNFTFFLNTILTTFLKASIIASVIAIASISVITGAVLFSGYSAFRKWRQQIQQESVFQTEFLTSAIHTNELIRQNSEHKQRIEEEQLHITVTGESRLLQLQQLIQDAGLSDELTHLDIGIENDADTIEHQVALTKSLLTYEQQLSAQIHGITSLLDSALEPQERIQKQKQLKSSHQLLHYVRTFKHDHPNNLSNTLERRTIIAPRITSWRGRFKRAHKQRMKKIKTFFAPVSKKLGPLAKPAFMFLFVAGLIFASALLFQPTFPIVLLVAGIAIMVGVIVAVSRHKAEQRTQKMKDINDEQEHEENLENNKRLEIIEYEKSCRLLKDVERQNEEEMIANGDNGWYDTLSPTPRLTTGDNPQRSTESSLGFGSVPFGNPNFKPPRRMPIFTPQIKPTTSTTLPVFSSDSDANSAEEIPHSTSLAELPLVVPEAIKHRTPQSFPAIPHSSNQHSMTTQLHALTDVEGVAQLDGMSTLDQNFIPHEIPTF